MTYYLHPTPGRVRVKIRDVKGSPHKAKRVEKLFESVEGVDSATLNVLTDSLGVNQDADSTGSETIGARTAAPTPRASRVPRPLSMSRPAMIPCVNDGWACCQVLSVARARTKKRNDVVCPTLLSTQRNKIQKGLSASVHSLGRAIVKILLE